MGARLGAQSGRLLIRSKRTNAAGADGPDKVQIRTLPEPPGGMYGINSTCDFMNVHHEQLQDI